MPLKIIKGPLSVFVAPAGEAFPDLADAPAGNWVELGTAGAKGTTEDGVRIRTEQTTESDAFRSLGGTGPRAIARTAEDTFVEFELMEATAELRAYALDGDASRVTDTAAGSGTAGNLNQDNQRGLDMTEVALLLKKDPGSTALATGAMQYEYPLCSQVGNLNEVFVKGAPVMEGFSFQGIEHDTLGFGKQRIEDEVAAP